MRDDPSSRVLIGLFTAVRRPTNAIAAVRLRALAAEAALQNANFMVFSSEDVDLECEMIQGQMLDNDVWVERSFPIPDVVINPITPRTDIDVEVDAALRRLAPFTTTRIANKIGIAELLKDTPLQPHVIPYLPLEPGSAAGQIADFLTVHRRIVAKPAKGYRGQKIMFLTAAEGCVQVRMHAQEFTATIDDVAQRLQEPMREEQWLLQRFIQSRARGDRYFDVRVHVHKDGAGNLAVVRAYVRLSEAGLMVSNTSRGGYQGDINHFFASMKKDAPAMVERLNQLGIEVVRTLDQHYGGRIDEMGVDFLVDGMRHAWIAEVNSHPQSRYHEFERARFVIAYAKHLALAARTSQKGEMDFKSEAGV